MKKLRVLLALLFFCSILPALPGWAAAPVVGDLVVKESPWVDVRAFMDGLSGRPTLATWLANETTTDLTGVVTAANLAIHNNKGGSLKFPPGHTYLIAGQVIFPNDNTPIQGGVPPWENGVGDYARQYPIRWTSDGTSDYGGQVLQAGSVNGGAKLLMTYSGAGSAKIVTRGIGNLEIDHLTFVDSAGDNVPFLLTTGTTLNIHHNAFYGSKSGLSCDQDVFLLGGWQVNTFTFQSDNAAFQGYDSIIYKNHINGLRRLVYGKSYAQGVHIKDNFVGHSSGTNIAGGAIIEFDATYGQNGNNHITGNRFEVVAYPYGAKFIGSTGNYIAGNDFQDATATSLAAYYFDATASYNMVMLPNRSIISYTNEVVDLTAGKTNTVISAAATGKNNLQGYLNLPNTRSFGGTGPFLYTGATDNTSSAHTYEYIEDSHPNYAIYKYLVTRNGTSNQLPFWLNFYVQADNTVLVTTLTVDQIFRLTSTNGSIDIRAGTHNFESADGTGRAKIIAGGDFQLTTGLLDTKTGGSTTISTGVGNIKMSTANSDNNAVWIPMKYNGNTYYVPGFTTNAP